MSDLSLSPSPSSPPDSAAPDPSAPEPLTAAAPAATPPEDAAAPRGWRRHRGTAAFVAVLILIVAGTVVGIDEYRHSGKYLYAHNDPRHGAGMRTALGAEPAASDVLLLGRHAVPGLGYGRPSADATSETGWHYGWLTASGLTCIEQFTLSTAWAGGRCFPQPFDIPALDTGVTGGCAVINVYGVTSAGVTAVQLISGSTIVKAGVAGIVATGVPTSYAFAVSLPVGDAAVADLRLTGLDAGGQQVVTRSITVPALDTKARHC